MGSKPKAWHRHYAYNDWKNFVRVYIYDPYPNNACNMRRTNGTLPFTLQPEVEYKLCAAALFFCYHIRR
jgi:hypothetical protein